MKELILTKPVIDPVIGHLYEHIFCDHLASMLRKKGLFAYVDYHIDAKNYHNGFVVVRIELYTEEAALFFNDKLSIEPSFNDRSINGALLQIMAELKSDIVEIKDEIVLKRLEDISKTQWNITYSKYDKITPPNKLTLKPAITYNEVSLDHFGVITQIISIEAQDIPKDLHPLFLVVSKSIRSNLQEDIANSFFCFTYEDRFENKNGKLLDINLYLIDKRQPVSITDEEEVARDLLRLMKNNEFSERLSTSLHKVPPNSKEISTKLGIHTQKDYWKTYGTIQNITDILQKITISFNFS